MIRFILSILVIFTLTGCGGGGSSSGNSTDNGSGTITPISTDFIKVDQFGYTTTSIKKAVISDPVRGYNASESYTPADNLEVRSADDYSLVYTGSISAFNSGNEDTQSGDILYYFDFSSVTAEGNYYIYDPDNNTVSDMFTISDDVYSDALKQAVRTFFYQRAGFNKDAEYAGTNWADTASHIGAEQDTDCRLMVSADPNSSDAGTTRDLSGGWYDAGDFNKYVNFADGAIHSLLFAYQETPTAFTDDYNIPESGNNIPDLLDEIKYEMDWMLKMQEADGSVLLKVASISWDATTPPSTDTVKRRYAPVTASATISLAGAAAHSAIVYADIDPAYSATLKTAAEDAWDWLQANPGQIPSTFDNAGFVNADSEDSEADQLSNMLAASVYLYLLTGEAEYQTYITNNIEDALFMKADGWLAYDGVDEEVQNALLYYADSAGADPALSADIKSTYESMLVNEFNDFAPLLAARNAIDGYMAYIDTYYWGSSRAKAQAGSAIYNTIIYNTGSDSDEMKEIAEGYLHYFHGINPQNIVYMSNMNEHGAKNSVDEFYHMWFTDGSDWDNVNDSYGPPPGYIVGGANENYDINGVYVSDIIETAALIINQPPAKAYKSWNDADDESYRITENSITYQSAYIRLLSKFK